MVVVLRLRWGKHSKTNALFNEQINATNSLHRRSSRPCLCELSAFNRVCGCCCVEVIVPAACLHPVAEVVVEGPRTQKLSSIVHHFRKQQQFFFRKIGVVRQPLGKCPQDSHSSSPTNSQQASIHPVCDDIPTSTVRLNPIQMTDRLRCDGGDFPWWQCSFSAVVH